MNYIRFYLVTIILLFSCSNNDSESLEDDLNEIGFLGRWEITGEITNGNISDMLPKCCQFFEFTPDENKQDLTGFFTYTDGQGIDYSGVFTIDPSNQIIILQRDGRNATNYGYSLDGSQGLLTLSFLENNTNFVQDWIRID